MSTVDLSPTLGILRSLYKHVQILVDFADNIVFREGRKVMLIEESDTSQFKSFVRGIFVCFDKELQQVPSCNQVNFQYLLITINNTHSPSYLTLSCEEFGRVKDSAYTSLDVTQFKRLKLTLLPHVDVFLYFSPRSALCLKPWPLFLTA